MDFAWVAYGSLLILFLVYVVWPLSKKRPVLLKGRGMTLVLVACASTIFVLAWVNYHPIWLAALLLILLQNGRLWIVGGISREDVISALERAANSTRSPLDVTSGTWVLSDQTKIRILRVLPGCICILFSTSSLSKKEALTRRVLGKFIQNYFVRGM